MGRKQREEDCERISMLIPKTKYAKLKKLSELYNLGSMGRVIELLIDNTSTNVDNVSNKINRLEKQELEITNELSKIKEEKIKLNSLKTLEEENKSNRDIERRKAVSTIYRVLSEGRTMDASNMANSWSIRLQCLPEEILAEALIKLKSGN
jgi:hypothetical protein